MRGRALARHGTAPITDAAPRVKASSFGTRGQPPVLSKGVPAKLAVVMAVRAVLACEMTITTGLAT